MSALFEECVLLSTFLSCIWNKNFLQSNAGVLSVLILGVCKFYSGIMLCVVWYDVIDPVGDNFGLFSAGNGSSNPAKFHYLCGFEIKKNCLGRACYVVLLCAGWLLDGLWPTVDLLRVLPGEGKKKKTKYIEKLSVGLEHCVKYYGLCYPFKLLCSRWCCG